MVELIGVLGFSLAGASVISNDALQTLGSFMNSNSKIKWYWLWAFAALILILTLGYGQLTGDMAFGRLNKIPYIEPTIWHALAPLTLLFLTKKGIPVSTSFLVLSAFASSVVIEKMFLKSVFGYVLAAIVAYVLWLVISKIIDETTKAVRYAKAWKIAQWSSTGFLWSMWLTQDHANVAVFLPRGHSNLEAAAMIAFYLGVLAWVFYKKGGKIQNVIRNKTSTKFVRSCTIIDLVYAFLLLYFKMYNDLPLSTSFVFLGLLAGRELALNKTLYKKTFPVIAKDAGKLAFGIGISLAMVFLIQYLK